MGYKVELKRTDGKLCRVVVNGGVGDATFDVTFNYSNLLTFIDPALGIRWLDGKTGSESTARLQFALDLLGNSSRYEGSYHTFIAPWSEFYEINPDFRSLLDKASLVDLDAPGNESLLQLCKSHNLVHDIGGVWKSTPGNVGFVVKLFLSWSKMCPSGIWVVS